MGLFSDIFSGGQKESQGSKQARRAQSQLGQNIFEQAQAGIKGIPSEFTSGWPTFDEQLSGPSNLEAMSLAGLENLASGGASGATYGQQFQQGRDVISEILSGGPSDIEDYFQKTVQDPAMRAYQETVLPSLRGSAVGGGNLFSDQQRGAENQSLRDLTEGLSRERTRIAFEERQRDTQNKLAAMGLTSAMSNAEASYMNQLLQAGATPRQIQWAQTAFRLQEFMRQQQQAEQRQSFAGQLATNQIQPAMYASNSLGGFLSGILNPFASSAGSAAGEKAGAGAAEGIGSLLTAIFSSCWVAAVYFGWGTPEWHAARRWLMHDWQGPGSRLFRRIYLRHGRTVAHWTRRSSLVHAILKPLFVWAARRGA